MKIAITGATGHLGQLVVKKLKDKGADIIALVRTPSKAEALGVEARAFDYSKSEGLTESLKGVDHLLLISGSEVGQREQQHKNVIAAAKEAGVKWIVYTSLLHADKSTTILGPEHVATEKALKDSRIPYTILRNGWYSENYAASIPSALQTGQFIGSAGEGKISSATRSDYADAAVAVLTSSGQEGKVYELAGDESYTLADLAAEVSRQTGKDIPYNDMSESEYTAVLTQAGLPAELAAAYANFDTGTANGDYFDDQKQLSSLIRRPTTPLSESVKIALA